MRLAVSTDKSETDRRVRITFEEGDVWFISGKEIWQEVSLAEWTRLISKPIRFSQRAPKDVKFK
jgi:hypothetical protein